MTDEWGEEPDDRRLGDDDEGAVRYQVPFVDLIGDYSRGLARIVANGVVPRVTKVVARPWDGGPLEACAEVVVEFAESPRTKVAPFSFSVFVEGLDVSGRRRLVSDGDNRLTSLQQVDREYNIQSEAPARGFGGLHDVIVEVTAGPVS